jgi:transposase
MYTKQEKAWWVKKHYGGLSFRQVCEQFSHEFPNRPKPSHTTAMRVSSRFEKTGELEIRQTGNHAQREVPVTDYVLLNAIESNPYASCRGLAGEVGLSHSHVNRRLHKYGYKSYKTHTSNELQPGDPDRRYTFAMAVAELQEEDPQFLRKVLFTDEASFTLHHAPNKQNHRCWSKTNPRSFYCNRTQYPRKINVWAGILNQTIIGPILIDGNLTGEKYRSLLQGEISQRLADLQLEDEIYYQHDGCPAHNDRFATEWLHNAFPGKVIGTYEDLAWPARSPDLSCLDFFLWGHIKTKIYDRRTPFQNVDTLWDAVNDSCTAVTYGQLANVQREISDRIHYCINVQGELFEHLLN